MTGDRSLLTDITFYKGDWVVFGDRSKGQVLGCGTLVCGNFSVHDVSLVEN
jgi:hypothetical protein